MRILIVGGGGFIGRRIAGRLLAAGHEVSIAARQTGRVERIFPGVPTIKCDLAVDTEIEIWRSRLAGFDAVVNAAGVLQDRAAAAIHVAGPRALFEACRICGVRRIVHISAVSADEGAGTDYAATKLAGEHALMATGLDWVILRPSLVYGEGSHGGTSLLRGLAGFPCLAVLPGGGNQQFQPIHVDDLARAVEKALLDGSLAGRRLSPAGPDILTLKEVVVRWRAWLGFPPARSVSLPMGLIRIAGWIGDRLNLAPINSTAIAQLTYGNTTDAGLFEREIGFRPRGFDAALRARPANVQDRWHARLYWLRLGLRFGLALFWLASGAIGFVAGASIVAALAPGLGAGAANVLGLLACLVDIAIGVGLTVNLAPRRVAAAQLVLTVGYPALLTLLRPSLWLDPFGSIVKNLPLLLAVLCHAALIDDR
ncbi:MAG TPA: SDR family oxidoreductase [Dongiaceae bacterium]|nr:SDR family oxidoreductase [Dongiaceae bacterium]